MTATELAPGADQQSPSRKGIDDKWIALTNTTLGVFMATVNASVVLISLPAIFRGIHLNPLAPQNVSYLLWMLMGYMLITAVLVVSLGRLGDMYGRVKIYNAGFAVFAIASVILALVPFDGGAAALWLIGFRVLQGIGGAMLMANSTAILTDAFPAHQRGMALGFNQVAALAGSFGGLVIGGILSEWHWRAVFWVSVPVGIIGAVWAFRSLKEVSHRRAGRIDWWGNLTFAVGLISLLAGITYGIQPYGGHPEGWTNPTVLAALILGALMLIGFVLIERRVAQPMFHLELFKIRTFWTGQFATLMSSIARGGLQFMLIIWLQGIWLPLHGYAYEKTPLWAGIYLLPLTVGFLLAGPLSGFLSDRFGPRPFTVGGPILVALSFVGMLFLPADFSYPVFAALLALNGIGSGLFSAPNTTAIMNAVPREQRGSAGGMSATFLNAGMVLSIGVFFSLLIAGLATSLPATMTSGLIAQGVPADAAGQIAATPPVGTLFAAFLGYNPIQQLLDATGATQAVPAGSLNVLTGQQFFPHLISEPFHGGLVLVFGIATVMVLLAGVAAAFRGKTYVYAEPTDAREDAEYAEETGATR